MVGLSNLRVPQEGVRHEEQNTTLHMNNRQVGKGTLYITESVLTWINGDTGKGISLQYPNIALHAISRDTTALHPMDHLYVMVDAHIEFLDDPPAPDNNEENCFEEPVTEIRFSPDNVSSLEAMFLAMNECQALHPDPEQESLSDEEEIYEDAEEEEFEYSQGNDDVSPFIMASEHVESTNGNTADEMMDVEAGQFEDAEENP